ncbi:MAG: hypothetical protein MI923_29730 [Phycisphaerales bacterium]|nr:hypothetical protein [Phycisphaerales bacterium]
MIVFSVALTATLLGCSGGVGSTVEDNKRAFNRVVDYDMRMLVDDILLFTMTHDVHRTSRWIID